MTELILIFKSGHKRTAIVIDYVNSDYTLKGYYIGMIERTPLSMSDSVVMVEVIR